MIHPKDLYTYHVVQTLVDQSTPSNNAAGKPFGRLLISYEIKRYRDLRNLTDSLAYQILCTQRIIIPNENPFKPGPINSRSFSNYPAIVDSSIKFQGQSPEIVTYFPQTVNSSVETSVSSSDDASNTATMQHTSGSSTSQSNTFGASASIGFFGDAPTGGISASYDQTSGSEHSQSTLAGREVSSSRQSSAADSMSVKDWACDSYYTVSNDSPPIHTLNWVWGQEYPWNVIKYRYGQTTGSDEITLPLFVKNLLLDVTKSTNQVLPPSQLSQFGLDFTMTSIWIVKPATTSSDVTIEHDIQYYTATHQLTGNTADTFSAEINNAGAFSFTSPALNLYAYGLDPIMRRDGFSHVAIIGFVPRQFRVLPSPVETISGHIKNPTPFTIISTSNNLLIQDTTDYSSSISTADKGAGFTVSETELTATFSPQCQSLTMTLKFKLIDAINSYKLYLKHWVTNPMGIKLSVLINGDTASQMVKFVNALEAEGGENNLLSISLRNLNYGSIEYHDYLNLGFNEIDIKIEPIGGLNSDTKYQIRAISIEQE